MPTQAAVVQVTTLTPGSFWGRWGTRLAAWLLKNSRLSIEDRQILTAAMCEKLGALPLHARILIAPTGVFVDGKQVTMEVAKNLQESSKGMLNNFARRFVREQVRFMAVQQGVHQNTSPEQGLFAKAMLFQMQEEDDIYLQLAGDSE